jgi:hypothetical protein
MLNYQRVTPQFGDLLNRLITCFLPFTKWDDLPFIPFAIGHLMSLVCAHPLFGAGIVGATPGTGAGYLRYIPDVPSGNLT